MPQPYQDQLDQNFWERVPDMSFYKASWLILKQSPSWKQQWCLSFTDAIFTLVQVSHKKVKEEKKSFQSTRVGDNSTSKENTVFCCFFGIIVFVVVLFFFFLYFSNKRIHKCVFLNSGQPGHGSATMVLKGIDHLISQLYYISTKTFVFLNIFLMIQRRKRGRER